MENEKYDRIRILIILMFIIGIFMCIALYPYSIKYMFLSYDGEVPKEAFVKAIFVYFSYILISILGFISLIIFFKITNLIDNNNFYSIKTKILLRKNIIILTIATILYSAITIGLIIYNILVKSSYYYLLIPNCITLLMAILGVIIAVILYKKFK